MKKEVQEGVDNVVFLRLSLKEAEGAKLAYNQVTNAVVKLV